MSHGYYVSAAIYRTLEATGADYARFLHNDGYSAAASDVKRFKLFTFSTLLIKEFRIDKSVPGTMLVPPQPVQLLISSPMDTFLTHLVTGLFSSGTLRIAGAEFEKRTVETLPDPDFSPSMSFTMLSPLLLSVSEREPEPVLQHQISISASTMPARRPAHYLRYDDPRLSLLLKQNLMNKYAALHGKPFTGEDTECQVRFSESYLRRRQAQGKSVEKLITVKAGTPEETRIKAIECPFSITASPELLKVGYDCGFGEKCSQGFGMMKLD